jgi:hypothetical protein
MRKTMDRAFVAPHVTQLVHNAEASIEAAMQEVMKLHAGLVQARADLGISAVALEPAMSDVLAAITGLGAGQAALTAGHSKLDRVRKALGLRTTGSGVWKGESKEEERTLAKSA